MNYLLKQTDLKWLPKPHTLLIYPSQILPPMDLITSVHAFAFLDEKLLMTHIRKRGWEIPGGHVEKGEDIQKALVREIKEETNAYVTDLSPLAYSKIHLYGPKSVHYPYPYPISYQIFYIAAVHTINIFIETDEVIASALWTPEQVQTSSWGQKYIDLFTYAFRNWKSKTNN